MSDRPTSPAKHRSWGQIALITVLVLSLFGNAVALGALVRLREVREDLLGPDLQVVILPDAMRKDLRAAIRERRAELAPALRSVLLTRRALVEAMTARPHDRATTEARMVEFRADLDRLLAVVQVILLDRLDAR